MAFSGYLDKGISRAVSLSRYNELPTLLLICNAAVQKPLAVEIMLSFPRDRHACPMVRSLSEALRAMDYGFQLATQVCRNRCLST